MMQKARSGPYTMMLVIALLAQAIACGVLLFELKKYDWQINPPPITVQLDAETSHWA